MRGPWTKFASTLPVMSGRVDWDKAACAGMSVDNFDTFFKSGPADWMPDTLKDMNGRAVPVQRGEPFDPEPAKAVCARCVIRMECLSYALANHTLCETGVWGGATENERRQLRGLPVVAECGTAAAYRRHKSADEPPCGPCHEAYNRSRQADRKKRADREAARCKQPKCQRKRTSGKWCAKHEGLAA